MDVAADSARAQVERLLRSKTFEGSEIHRHLLQYLAERSLAGDADRLKEYTVGLEAFGKPPSYDPRQDSIVRLQVGRVRQKLTAYYQGEAAPEELRVTLPKGGFKLGFESPPPAAPESWYQQRRLTGVLVIALIALGVWAGYATFGWLSMRRQFPGTSGTWTPELQALWRPFLESDRSLLLCLGTPLFVRLPDYGFFRDPKANDWPGVEGSQRIGDLRKALRSPALTPAYSFTGVGEAGAAFLIAKLLSARRPELLLTYSNILSWQQIADHNVIFLGPPKFNPQLLTREMTRDIVVEPEGIRNLKPRPGEPAFLRDNLVVEKQSEGETHALISRIPGVTGVGEILIIAGNASPDTLAAAEWLTQPWHARELLERLRTPGGAVPRHFQAVIKVAYQQRIPVRSSYVFHHVIEDRK